MKFFLKLNGVSFLFALPLFIGLEWMLNVYRFNRVLGIDLHTVMWIGMAVIFLLGVGCSVGGPYLIGRYLEPRKSYYWTTILWIPYFLSFVLGISFFFPITYGGDEAVPLIGLVMMAGMLIYAFWIAILFFVGQDDKSNKAGGPV